MIEGTLEESIDVINNLLADIAQQAATNPEGAQGTEAYLYEMTLKMIAAGCENASELAQLALSSKNIAFTRCTWLL